MYKAIILALVIAVVGSVSDWLKDEPLLHGKTLPGLSQDRFGNPDRFKQYIIRVPPSIARLKLFNQGVRINFLSTSLM